MKKEEFRAIINDYEADGINSIIANNIATDSRKITDVLWWKDYIDRQGFQDIIDSLWNNGYIPDSTRLALIMTYQPGASDQQAEPLLVDK